MNRYPGWSPGMFAVALLASSEVSGLCTTSNGLHPDHEAVKIVVESSASELLEAIRDGYWQWNEASCRDYYNPAPYPFFSESASDPTITIRKVEGSSPPNLGSGCASIQATASGGTITLYSTVELSSGTHACDYSSLAKASDIVAHELGHFLGLNESSCEGVIMGPQQLLGNNGTAWDITPERQITSTECAQADYNSSTPWEESEAGCSTNPSCDPYSPCFPECNCPILVDLAGDGIRLSKDPVKFDLNANGFASAVSWTSAGQFDAFLCLDRNGNGKIDDGRELFGSATRLENGLEAAHGFLALAEIDQLFGGNRDGVIDSRDLHFASLCLWTDLDHDGRSDRSELTSLDAAGIERIELTFEPARSVDALGNEFRYVGRAWIRRHGQLVPVPMTDVFFASLE